MKQQDLLDPQIEGLQDYARLNIKPETLANVNEANVTLSRRRDLIVAAIAALDALQADNYPVNSAFDVTEAVHQDLLDNLTTISAAYDRFRERVEATAIEIKTGEPELK